MPCGAVSVVTPAMWAAFDASVTKIVQRWIGLVSGRASLTEVERALALEKSELDAAMLTWGHEDHPDLESERHSRAARKKALCVTAAMRPTVMKGKVTRLAHVRSDLPDLSALAAASIPAPKERGTRRRGKLRDVRGSTGEVAGQQ